jgi:putative flippase GtrA
MTSHDVVAMVRRPLGIKKVGHCGTLDPLATGMLLVVVGRGTKIQDLLMAEDKEYTGTMRLGITTDSQDADGQVRYQLSAHAEKVFQWLQSLQTRAFVGTESRFRLLVDSLRDVVEHTDDDRARRLEILKDRKAAIEQEIRALELGVMDRYNNAQVQERLELFTRLCYELVSDFREVEDNFKQIHRSIVEQHTRAEQDRGAIVGFAFEAYDSLRGSNQGRSFYAFWDFLISILHSLSLRLLPRRAISFGLVGVSGVAVQLLVTQLLMLTSLGFEQALPFAVVAAASSNYLINNALTFRFQRLKGLALLRGLLKFLLVASLPVLANVGLASAFYSLVARDTLWAQLSGILVVFVWNYAASSRFVWNTP